MQKKILIIEDDKNLLLNIKELLEEEGYLVQTTTDGKTGLELIFNWKPELILCDITIPILNGYEILNEVLKNSSAKGIPFIFLTAKTDKDDRNYALKMGAADYISKPFQLEDLIDTVNIYLERNNGWKHEPDFDMYRYKLKPEDEFPMLIADKKRMVKVSDLKYVKIENPYIMIKASDERSYSVEGSINEWEEILPENIFIRIHRGVIINSAFISKIEKINFNSYLVYLKGETEPFLITKRYSEKLKDFKD